MSGPKVLTPAEVAEIEKRFSACAVVGATVRVFVDPEAWTVEIERLRDGKAAGTTFIEFEGTPAGKVDADFVAAAFSDVPRLCATITRLRELIEGMECGYGCRSKIGGKCNCVKSQVDL